jgi:hypothetical protein
VSGIFHFHRPWAFGISVPQYSLHSLHFYEENSAAIQMKYLVLLVKNEIKYVIYSKRLRVMQEEMNI